MLAKTNTMDKERESNKNDIFQINIKIVMTHSNERVSVGGGGGGVVLMSITMVEVTRISNRLTRLAVF